MAQELFFYKVGPYDRKKNLDKKIAELNKDGWMVKSVSFNETTNEYMLLAEKTPPPFLSFKSFGEEELEEELEEARQYLKDNFEELNAKHRPIFLSEPVITRNGNTLEFDGIDSLREFIKAIHATGVDTTNKL